MRGERRRRAHRAGRGASARRRRARKRRTIAAAKGVICSMTPSNSMPPAQGLAHARRRRTPQSGLKPYRYGKGDLQIHYALKEPPSWSGDKDLAKVALLHLTPGTRRRLARRKRVRARPPARRAHDLRRPAHGARSEPRAARARRSCGCRLPEAPRFVKGDAMGEIATPLPMDAGRRPCARRSPIGSSGGSRAISRSGPGQARPPGLFAGRPRDDERQSRRRRSLRRLLRARPVLPLAAVRGKRQSQDGGSRRLPHRRLDPSRPGPRRSLRLPSRSSLELRRRKTVPGAAFFGQIIAVACADPAARRPTLGEIGFNQFAPYLINSIWRSWVRSSGRGLEDARA